jgi:FeS assembly SUF system regulator
MIRINRETDYSVLILSLLAEDPARRYSARVVAARRGLPQPVVSKILKQLVQAGLLVSSRGARGGYGLARAPDAISIGDIVAAMEGPISLTQCTGAAPNSCEYQTGCVASSNWNRINTMLQETLNGFSLQDMITPLPSGPGREAFVPLTALSR